MKIGIINGPNLNLLGIRETHIYSDITFEAYFAELKSAHNNIELVFYQSNHEGELIDKIHEWGFSKDGIIINAGGYTHTSIALADAIKAVSTPFIEVHISNVFAREKFRHHSYLSAVCIGGIFGLGLRGYNLAIKALEIDHTK